MNKIKQKNILIKRKGMTLIEIIVSLAILAIIIVPFLNMFVQSTVTNKKSETILDATYVAQREMEYIYSISKSKTFIAGRLQLTDNDGFTQTNVSANNNYSYTKNVTGYFINIQIMRIVGRGNLVKLLVKIYDNSSMSKLESQMETILPWND
ncbi:prepilin-type N-terminal cleavage/methylation domain-containing protein [Clostridium estertheticum]|uniref:type IV pilus modification PilV family protein n=1 Tax=Clostridium estertheticum TaxID=238834 RepID=UPI001CF39F5C|nr:prepilin-type N-terminal cleavage/methylation domain-containing protein [Clostridium estertheticum]MCB2355922.1 type II secretion system GspH family protein [Clostridium estertheticum]WAG42304.1 type II secretion system GspH family protein [Clostridium estertheticum]